MSREHTILIQNASIYQAGSGSTELLEADIFIKAGKITAIGQNIQNSADRVIDADGKVVMPGFADTHDHSPQAFLKDIPELQNTRIDKWIGGISERSKQMDPEAHHHAAKIKFLELLSKGVPHVADMVYLFPQAYDHKEIAERIIDAAQEVGIRYTFLRGSMSLSQKDGADFPDDVVETSEQIATRTEEIIRQFHNPDGTVTVGVAPCTLFTNTPEDYENAAQLAEDYNLVLQTHLSESEYEQSYVQDHYGMTPLKLLHSLGWDNARASFAHCIELSSEEINLLYQHGNSVCHCPISNSRSPVGQGGIAPIFEMLHVGVNVAIGTDGSAGNNSGDIQNELKWARTIAGALKRTTYLKVHDVLDMGTINGAIALNQGDTNGSIEVGKNADIAIFNPLGFIGSVGTWDLASSLISCTSIPAEMVLVAGVPVIENERHVSIDIAIAIQEANAKWKEVFQ